MNDIYASYFAKTRQVITRLELLKARLLGKLVRGADGDHEVVGYQYRGKFYVTDERSITDAGPPTNSP